MNHKDMIEKLAEKRLKSPNLKILAAELFAPIGGIKGLVIRIWDEYDKSDAGSNNRTTLLRSCVDLLKILAQSGNDDGDGIDDLTPEELESTVKAIDFGRIGLG